MRGGPLIIRRAVVAFATTIHFNAIDLCGRTGMHTTTTMGRECLSVTHDLRSLREKYEVPFSRAISVTKGLSDHWVRVIPLQPYDGNGLPAFCSAPPGPCFVSFRSFGLSVSWSRVSSGDFQCLRWIEWVRCFVWRLLVWPVVQLKRVCVERSTLWIS